MSTLYSDSNRASLRLLKESNTAWGVTPASGKTKEVRITSSSIAANKDTVVSDELRSDRMVSSVPEVGASTSGDLNFEFAAGSQDDLLESFLLGSFTRDVPFYKFEGTTVAVASSTTFTISGGDYTDYFTNGRAVRLSGFLSQANNDFATVSGTSYSSPVTTVTVSGPTLVAEAGNSKSKVQAADDVLVARNTTISAVASTSSFDSSSGDPFAGMEAAGTLVVGQKINVTGLGHETGTVTVATIPADNETLTIADGLGNVIILDFDNATGVPTGNIAVDISDTPIVGVLAARIAAAINGETNKGNINVSAVVSSDEVTIKNLVQTGMVLTDGTSGNLTIGAPSGGVDSANGVFTITSIADDSIGVTPAPSNVSAGSAVTIQASMLRNPSGVSGGTLPHEVIQPQSFTMETGFRDVNQYFLHDGLRIGSFSLSVSTGAIVTGTAGVQGKQTSRKVTETLTGGSYTVLDAPTNQVMNATTNVGSLELNGQSLATAMRSFEMSGESTLRNQPGIGSKFPTGIGTGRFNLTGTVEAYFATADLYNAFIEHDTVSLSLKFEDLDNNTYVITLPALKFAADPISPTGIDQDVMENLEWIAFRDPATKAMIQVDRFSNVLPVGAHT